MRQQFKYGDDMLRLDAIVDPEGQVEPSLKLVWGPTPAAIQHLAEAGAVDAHLLLVVEQNGSQRQRLVLPLKWGTSYLTLRQSGKNTIHATIVWSDDPQDRSAKRVLLPEYHHPSYVQEVLVAERPSVAGLRLQVARLRLKMLPFEQQEEELSRDQQIEYQKLADQLSPVEDRLADALSNEAFVTTLADNIFDRWPIVREAHQLGYASMTVEVPEQMFATSWRITEMLGYFITEKPARDNCDLRRRAILSAIVAPVFMAGMLLLMAIAFFVTIATVAVALIAGRRGIDYSCLRPNSLTTPVDIWQDSQPSRWWYKEVQDAALFGGTTTSYVRRHQLSFVVNPPAILAVMAISFALLWIVPVQMALLLPATIWFALVIIMVGLAGLRLALDESESGSPELGSIDYRPDYEYQSITSSLQSPQPPTLRLRYQEVKARICKPFSAKI